jgi:hypothetical protein
VKKTPGEAAFAVMLPPAEAAGANVRTAMTATTARVSFFIGAS